MAGKISPAHDAERPLEELFSVRALLISVLAVSVDKDLQITIALKL
jgi:hypothetical protein